MVQRVDASGQFAVSVTPSDTVNLTMPSGTSFTKGIYVGVAGDLKVDMADGSTITFTNLASGVVHPLSVKRVYAAGTTATGIVGVY